MFTKRQTKLILLVDVLLLTGVFGYSFLGPMLSNVGVVSALALLLQFGATAEPISQNADVVPSPTLSGLPEIPRDTLHADFTWADPAIPGKVAAQFTDQSSGNPIAWYWNFGDGKSAKGQNQIHTYASSGLYKVKLTVVNATHHSDTIVIVCSPRYTPGVPVARSTDGGEGAGVSNDED